MDDELLISEDYVGVTDDVCMSKQPSRGTQTIVELARGHFDFRPVSMWSGRGVMLVQIVRPSAGEGLMQRTGDLLGNIGSAVAQSATVHGGSVD